MRSIQTSVFRILYSVYYLARSKLMIKFMKGNSQLIFSFYLFSLLLLIVLPLNSSSQLNNQTILVFRADYFIHALLFLPWFGFAAVFNLSWRWWLVYGLFWAAGLEILQYFLPYRSYNCNDLLANCLGVLLSFILYVVWRQLLSAKFQD